MSSGLSCYQRSTELCCATRRRLSSVSCAHVCCALLPAAAAAQSLKKVAILLAQFLRKFCLFAQNRNFSQILPWCAIFAQIYDLAEQSSQILQFARNLHEDIYVFPLKFAFSVLGWHALNFCINWAKIGLLCNHKTYTRNFRSIFRPFSADFQLNLHATCANCAQF